MTNTIACTACESVGGALPSSTWMKHPKHTRVGGGFEREGGNERGG